MARTSTTQESAMKVRKAKRINPDATRLMVSELESVLVVHKSIRNKAKAEALITTLLNHFSTRIGKTEAKIIFQKSLDRFKEF